MLSAVLLLCFVDAIVGRYQVLEVIPRNRRELSQLVELAETSSLEEVDIWHMPGRVNESVHVMCGPNCPRHLLPPDQRVRIDDFAEQLRLEQSKVRILGRRAHDGPSLGLPLGQYHSYSAISASLMHIASRVPYASAIDIGGTAEGRRILALKIGHDDGRKPVIVIDGTMHAREWATVHTALYFINMLVHEGADSRVPEYLNRLVFYVIPVVNPDGYEYTRTNATDPRYRMWRKNRGRETCMNDGRGQKCCKGVDLNRNFDFRFGETGSSKYICSEIYHGPHAFSEPETIALRNFFFGLGSRVKAYITLHSYSQLWIYSYSHRGKTYPRHINDLRRVAAKAVQELAKMYGTKYQFGTGPEIIYSFAGGATDWATETMRVKYAYTLELRPMYTEWNGFVMDPSELVPTARETWAGVKVVIEQVLAESPAGFFRHHRRSPFRRHPSSRSRVQG